MAAAASALAKAVVKHRVHHKQDRNLLFTDLSCPGPVQHTDSSDETGPQLHSKGRGRV